MYNSLPLPLPEPGEHSAVPENPDFTQYLQVMGGNVSTPDEAQVVLLGERHDDLVHHLAIGDMLKQNAKAGDVLLLEGSYIGEPVSTEVANYKYWNIPGAVTIEGWDSRELSTEAEHAVIELGLAHHLVEAAQRQEAPEKLARAMDHEEKARARFHDVVILQRNETMRAAIHNVLEKGAKRVFVQAGYKHYTDDPNLQHYLGERPFLAYTVNTPDDLVDTARSWFRQASMAGMSQKEDAPEQRIETISSDSNTELYIQAIANPAVSALGVSIKRISGSADGQIEMDGRVVPVPEGYSAITISAPNQAAVSAFWAAVDKISQRTTR